MIYSNEVENMCPVRQGVAHGAAPIPEEAKWVKATQITDISGFTHGVGWCAPQQGTCKLTLNVKDGVIQEALVETLGCSGMALNEDDEIIGYQYVNFGKMMDFIKGGDDANTAFEKAKGQYGRVADAVKIVDPRKE